MSIDCFGTEYRDQGMHNGREYLKLDVGLVASSSKQEHEKWRRWYVHVLNNRILVVPEKLLQFANARIEHNFDGLHWLHYIITLTKLIGIYSNKWI